MLPSLLLAAQYRLCNYFDDSCSYHSLSLNIRSLRWCGFPLLVTYCRFY